MPRSGIGNYADKAREKSDETKRAPISMRVTPRLRAALEESAASEGRSIAQEVEQRLERSLETEHAVGGPHTAALFAALARDIADIEAATGRRWHEDLRTFGAVRHAFAEQIANRMPIPADKKKEAKEIVAAMAGLEAVDRMIDADIPAPPWFSEEERAKWPKREDSVRFYEEQRIAVEQQRHALMGPLEAEADQGVEVFREIENSRDAARAIRS